MRKPQGLSQDLKAGKDFANNREALKDLMSKGFTLAKKDEGSGDSTGTLRLAVPKPAAETPAEGDLAIARAAASDARAQ